MCAKYYSSSKSDAHTVCPADSVSLPAKVVWLTTFFLKKEVIFVQLLGWPLARLTQGSAHEVCLKNNILD